MTITMIAAMDRKGTIGAEGTLPAWKLREDMRRFRRLTLGKPVIMGRKTYASIGKPLKGRVNIVLTRQEDAVFEGCLVAHSAAQALALASDAEEVMIIGGALVYDLFMKQARRLHLTYVEGEFEGDTRFPVWNPKGWHEVARVVDEADARNSHRSVFVTLERVVD